MTEQAVAWVRLGWREPFIWYQLGARMLLSLLPAALCFMFEAGILALFAFVLGALPWPVRVLVDDRGVTLRWLFLHHTVPAHSLGRVQIVNDSRRWAWPRRSVLLLHRQRSSPIMVFAPAPVLVHIARLAEMSQRSSRDAS